MLVRTSRFGTQFLGCSGYPECKTIMSMNVLTEGESEPQQPEVCEEKCDKCGSDMIFKTGPYGKYMECTNETCQNRNLTTNQPALTCPKCKEGTIVERKSKRGTVFYGCNKYPDCDFTLWNEPTGDVCPDCGALLVKKVLKKGTTIQCSNRSCGYKAPVVEEATTDPVDETLWNSRIT